MPQAFPRAGCCQKHGQSRLRGCKSTPRSQEKAVHPEIYRKLCCCCTLRTPTTQMKKVQSRWSVCTRIHLSPDRMDGLLLLPATCEARRVFTVTLVCVIRFRG